MKASSSGPPPSIAGSGAGPVDLTAETAAFPSTSAATQELPPDPGFHSAPTGDFAPHAAETQDHRHVPAPAPGPELLGEVRFGPYRVVRTLGQGGMGRVYEVEGPQGRRFALKTILSRSGPAAERARAASALRAFAS